MKMIIRLQDILKKIKTSLKSSWLAIVAFFLPVVLMQICYCYFKIWPYGDCTIFTWDLSTQYAPFFSFLREILVGKKNALYTLSGGLGSSLAGTIAYYLGSPFNILLLLFSKENLPVGITIIVQLKLACMSLFMFLFLQSRNKSCIAVLFSTAYSFCAYVVAYQSNVMWMDAVAFLPLVIWGIDRLIEKKKILLYVISLAITIMSCYYTAYMVCLFCVLYFLVMLIALRKNVWKEKIKRLFLFAGASIWSGALSAAVVLPGVLQTYGSSRSGTGLVALRNGARLYFQQSLVPMFLACSYDDSQRWEVIGFPLVYCGIMAVYGIFAFFFAKRIDVRKKIATGLIGCFLLVSYNHMNLFTLWHGLTSPHGAPWRFAFLGSFVMIVSAYEGTAQVLQGDKVAGRIALGLMSLYFGWIFFRFLPYRKIVLFNIIVFIGESLFLLCNKVTKKQCRELVSILSVIFLGIELCINAVYTWNQGFDFDSKKDYDYYITQMEQVVDEESKSLYRCETLDKAENNSNDGFLLGINTIEVYATSEKVANQLMLTKLGFGEDLFKNGSTRFARKLLGIKHLYTDSAVFPGYEAVDKSDGGIYRLEDANVLPLGFVVKEEADTWKMDDEKGNAFDFLNEYYRMLPNSRENQIYTLIEEESIGPKEVVEPICYVGENIYSNEYGVYAENIGEIDNIIRNTAAMTKSVQKETDSRMTITVENSFSKNAYVCVTVPYEKAWKARVNRQNVKTAEGMGGLLLIPVKDGTNVIELKYELLEQQIGSWLSLIALLGIGVVILIHCYKRKMPD